MLRIGGLTVAKRLTTVGVLASGTFLFHKNVTENETSDPSLNITRRNTEFSTNSSFFINTHLSEAIHDSILKPSEEKLKHVKPLLEASVRGMRLVKTVLMIILEYELDSCREPLKRALQAWGIENPTFFIEKNESISRLEKIVENRVTALKEAQHFYAEDEKCKASKDETERRRQQVIISAKGLAQAEEELSMAQEKAHEEGLGSGSDEDKDNTIHARGARRILSLCRSNGGTYIKIGQHLANLDHLLPPAYIQTLQSLFGDAPITPYEHVREVIKEELGKYPEEMFEQFETEPVAAASLAQVHVAREKGTNRKLAVKVQHRGLRETSKVDLMALETVVRLIDRLFDEFRWGWIVEEIAPNLPKELDFRHEGRNAEAAAAHLRKSRLNCVVPKVHWDRTTERVLVMDFEEGHSTTNLAAMNEMEVDKKELAVLISSVFQAQIFESGFVHCDPHPANVHWRKNTKNGKPELILLDHGLYKQIDDEFRVTYAQLWKSLLMADIKGIKTSCASLGVKKMYPLLAAMLTSRPFDEILERNNTKSFSAKESLDVNSDAAMIRGYAQQYLKEIIQMLDIVPRQMLLLFKMNDCLRHIDHSLGSPTNTMVVAGKYAARATFQHQKDIKGLGVMGRLRLWLSYLMIMSKIKMFELVSNTRLHRSNLIT